MTRAHTKKHLVQFASDHSLLVSFGNDISPENHYGVLQLMSLLMSARHAALANIHPAYSSVLISFDPRKCSPRDFRDSIASLADRLTRAPLPASRAVEIPVCYDEEFGVDLGAVAEHNKLSADEVIHLHSSAQYLVYFLGFSPGFPYLGGLPERLATPRLSSPRRQVPAGSVAIGGKQAGIYPIASPGGWRIIGRTPLRLFDARSTPHTYLQMGDSISFHPVARDLFEELLHDR